MQNPDENSTLAAGMLKSDHSGYDGATPTTQDMALQSREAVLADELKGSWHGLVLPNEEDVQVGAPNCQRCETLPRPMTESGRLMLNFPHSFTLGKVLTFLMEKNWQHKHCDGLVEIAVPAGALPSLVAPIVELLSGPEQRDLRAVYHFGDGLPQVSDFFNVESFPKFVAEVRSAWLVELLRAQAVYSVFQPIVHVPQDGEAPAVFGYECLMRGQHNGRVVAPDLMIQMARGADLIFQLDLAARRAALVGAGRHAIKEKVFINFSPNSIYDPWHCLRSTVNTVEEVGLTREQVVFEITETERLPSLKHLKRIMEFYREEGFQVALDDVGAGYSSLNVLIELKPDFVKLDMGLVQNVDRDASKAIVARKLIETVKELELCTIAEGVERPEELNWVREQGADLAQGYLFARPATPPPVLESRI